MGNIAIRVENLSKSYQITGRREKYRTLRESLMTSMATPFRRARHLIQGQAYGASEANETFWALQDVSFEVKHGEVIGIIGRNGAGKSTLLKILSRITEPTGGYADVYGRVGALLEVGTGFHQELTGRENIYLNGAILGMPREEISRKFDEIVAFAEVERFIDTPVKHYSSGMGLRLGFAVAAHLEPEILIVDEVLAVGDAAFQKKCLGKMSDVAGEGRTVLFVSHNMAAVQALCTRGVLLERGQVRLDADVNRVVQSYLSAAVESSENPFVNNPERKGTGAIRLTGARLLDEFGNDAQSFIAGMPLRIEYSYENLGNVRQARVGTTIYNHLGTAVTHMSMAVNGDVIEDLGTHGVFVCTIPNLPLPLGEYRLAVAVHYGNETADWLPNAAKFSVESSVFFSSGRTPSLEHATCLVQHQWEHLRNQETESQGLADSH